MLCFFFFKQKTAYDMRISDWSSDVCSSDLRDGLDDAGERVVRPRREVGERVATPLRQIERAIVEDAAEDPARVTRCYQPIARAEGEGLIGDREVSPDAATGSSCRIRPARIPAFRRHEQHRSTFLRRGNYLMRVGAIE